MRNAEVEWGVLRMHEIARKTIGVSSETSPSRNPHAEFAIVGRGQVS